MRNSRNKNSCILVVSDLHVPYHHVDSIPFLSAIKKHYDPDTIVFTGDEIDGHCISFHDTDPDLPFSPSSELEKSIEYLKEFYELFPKAYILESNHGSLVYRRQKHSGLPRSVFKSYNEILEAPSTWTWVPDLTLKASNGEDIYFHHSLSNSALLASRSIGMNYVQGHCHTKFELSYWASPTGVKWGATVGCLIDFDSLAFNYAKGNLKRPIIGCGIIIQGIMVLLPLIMNNKGRWVGRIT